MKKKQVPVIVGNAGISYRLNKSIDFFPNFVG